MKQLMMILWIGAVLALSACNFFAQPADLQTENLENEIASTQIVGVRQTATFNADRLLITLEYAQTSVGVVDQQGTRIAATLNAAGMLQIDTSDIAPVVSTNEPGSTNTSPNPVVSPDITDNIITPVAGGARSNIPIQQPPTPTPIATADPNVPRLSSVQLAEAVGVDDCPLGASTAFTTTTTDIYATAIAHNLTAAHTVSSRWLRDGQEVAAYNWSPNFNISQACIWFHLPSSAVEFVPGNWRVEIALDGALVGTPVDFTITGSVDDLSEGM